MGTVLLVVTVVITGHSSRKVSHRYGYVNHCQIIMPSAIVLTAWGIDFLPALLIGLSVRLSHIHSKHLPDIYLIIYLKVFTSCLSWDFSLQIITSVLAINFIYLEYLYPTQLVQ